MKKQLQITFLLTVLMSMMSIETFGYDAKVDGIYYIFSGTEATVTYYSDISSSNANAYTGEVTIPETVKYNSTTYSVTTIGSYAFYGCSGLTSVTIPNSVSSIGYMAFYGCSGLTSITIPNSVTSIGEDAFSGCTGLTSVTIPNSVTSIGHGAFDNTGWYNNQPDGVVYLGKFAYKCKGKMPANTSIILIEGTTGIADRAFYGCRDLTSVTIPNSVTSIGKSAFSKCTGLTSVTIPNSVTSIGSSAFYNCSGLTSVTIPNSVTSIGEQAFSHCSGLTSVTIPNSVKIIGDFAFQRCSGLKSVKSLNPLPLTTGIYVFNGVDKTIPLYVPKGSVLKYKAAEGWRDFVIIREISDGDNDVYLTINDGAHGKVMLKVDEEKPYVTLKLEADSGWQLYSVTLNGENVTGEVSSDGTYTTPAINLNSTLTVVYAQGGSAVRSLLSNRLQLNVNGSEIIISGTEGNEQVNVYTLDGKCLQSLTANKGQTVINVAARQTYIIKINEETFKVAL